MRSKSIFTTTLFVLTTVVASADPAFADPVAGAAIGAGVGAVAGHAVSGRDGALVGGALGAVAGYEIGKNRARHRTQTVQYRDRPVHHHHRAVRSSYAPRGYYDARPLVRNLSLICSLPPC